MRTKDDIERYLLDLDTPYEILGNGMYKLTDDEDDSNDEGILVCVNDPLIIFSVRLMKVPSKNQEEFYRKLLELNASELVAGAYGIAGDDVVITDTLQLENLDFNEFQASVESLALALRTHYPVLSAYRD